jgi:hypothetical protein
MAASLPIDPLNREDAVARLRAGLSALSNAEVRAIAVAAFEILVHAPEASDDLIELAVEDLVTAVPELEPVIALIVFHWRSSSLFRELADSKPCV